jgi:oxygen-dependent protoporphyrinogen oxidase
VTHAVVVGGGISGLAAAYRLRRLLGEQARITLLEQAATVGGKLRSIELAGRRFDVGAEAFLVRRPEALELVRELGLDQDLVYASAAGARLRFEGRTVPLPAHTLLGVPASADGLEQVLSAEGLAKVRAEPHTSMRWTGADVPVGPLVTERLGVEVTNRLVDPLLAGVYAGRTDRLGLRPTMPALASALDDAATAGRPVSLLTAAARVLAGNGSSNGHRSVFATLRGGLSTLVEALLAAARAQLRCGRPVRALHARPDGWRVEIGPAPGSAVFTAQYLDADAVLLAVPPPALRRLLAPLQPAAAAAAAGIEVGSSVIVSLALPARVGAVLRDASGVLVAAGERLHCKAFTFSSSKWPHLGGGDATWLRASINVTTGAAARLDDAELVRAVRADLAELTGITAAPIDTAVTRWGGGLPQYDVGHDSRVSAIEAGVAKLPRLAVAGAALHGVGIPACIATAEVAARQLVAALSSTN